MKSKSVLLSHCQIAARGLVLGFVFLIAGSASAQNLLSNPGFESPLSTNDWSIVYVYGGPAEWFPLDRATYRAHSGSYGALFRASTDALCHAYLTQTVSGLLPGTNYVVSGWAAWDGVPEQAQKFNIYMEAVGGLGSMTTPNAANNADASFYQFSLTQTADANGKIEVRLHVNRLSEAACCDHIFAAAEAFDDISLTRQ